MSLLQIFPSQRVGVTAKLPRTVPSYLPDETAGAHEWNYWNKSLSHKGLLYFSDLPSLYDLSRGQSVGLLVTPNGQLHLYLDGQHRKMIATGLPVNVPLWGAADIHGPCIKIKSEILSGE